MHIPNVTAVTPEAGLKKMDFRARRGLAKANLSVIFRGKIAVFAALFGRARLGVPFGESAPNAETQYLPI